jgi:hypothetical protein
MMSTVDTLSRIVDKSVYQLLSDVWADVVDGYVYRSNGVKYSVMSQVDCLPSYSFDQKFAVL